MAIKLNQITNPEQVGGFNTNFDLVEEYINNNLLNRNGLSAGEPNQMEVDLDMNGKFLLNTGVDLTNGKSVISVEKADLRYLGITGGSMEGELSLANNRLTHVPWPEQAGDATNKSYVDSLISEQGAFSPEDQAKLDSIEEGAQVNVGEEYTLAEKNKLAGIEAGAEVNTVTSVNAMTGAVTITKASIDLGNVDNTSDLNKPISTAQQTALDAKAPLDSPALTGTPTAPTPLTADNSTNIATTAYVNNKVDSVSSGVTAVDTSAPINDTGTASNPIIGIDSVTTTTDGAMLATDKVKIDGIEAGAEVNTVDSVAGKTGAVTLAKGDVGLSNVDNTSDLNKPVSTDQQAALDTKATLSENLNDLPNKATARTNLGLGTAAVFNDDRYLRQDVSGEISGALTIQDTFRIRSSGNRHLYFEDAGGSDQALIYHNEAGQRLQFRLRNGDGGTDSELLMENNGNVRVTVGQFAGNGSGITNLLPDSVGTAMSDMGLDAIGSFALLSCDTDTNPGINRGSGNLEWASASGLTAGRPSGTWKCMGVCRTTSAANRVTLFQRIS